MEEKKIKTRLKEKFQKNKQIILKNILFQLLSLP